MEVQIDLFYAQHATTIIKKKTMTKVSHVAIVYWNMVTLCSIKTLVVSNAIRKAGLVYTFTKTFLQGIFSSYQEQTIKYIIDCLVESEYEMIVFDVVFIKTEKILGITELACRLDFKGYIFGMVFAAHKSHFDIDWIKELGDWLNLCTHQTK